MINKMLSLFGLKLIKISDEYDILGKSYKFPLKAKGNKMIDSNGNILPFNFDNEEVCRLFVILFNFHSK